MSQILKTMLQDIINDRQEQASVTMHEYFVSKMREVAGLQEEKSMKVPSFGGKTPDVKLVQGEDGSVVTVSYRGKTVATISKQEDGTGWYAEARNKGEDQNEKTFEKTLDMFCQSADIDYK